MIPVTDHAVRRYIERVVGFGCYSNHDWREIVRFENASGKSADDIVALIAHEVEAAVPHTVIRNGTRRVIRGQTARFVIEAGRVMTVYGLESEEAA